MRITLSILFIVLVFPFGLKANQDKLDSLMKEVRSEKDDSVLLALYNDIGSNSYRIDQQMAKKYWLKAMPLAESFVKSDTAKYFKMQLATSYNGMGIISRREGSYSEALGYYQKCLKIENVISKDEVGTTLKNIAVIYREMEDYDKALEYVNISLDLAIKNNHKDGYSASYNAMGMIYRRLKDYDKALDCYTKSLDAALEIKNENNIAQSYNNIGAVYFRQKKYDKAIKYLEKGYQIHLENGNEAGIARHHSNLVAFYLKINDTKNAIKEGHLAYDSYLKMGRKNELSSAAFNLSNAYTDDKNYKQSLKYFKKHILYKDSVFNEKNTRELTQKEMQFNFDKQIMADSLARVEHERIQVMQHQQELNQQKMFLYGGGLILFIVIIFSVIIFNRLKITNKQKATIEQQKLIVEEKNKEITDSINYAKRIQTAILPSVDKIKMSFPNSFVLYKPKDIVAGDFYWYMEKAGKKLIAVADCTGHGVPGAMVSVVCNNALNRAVNDFNLIEPAKILDKTAELVIDAFKKSGEDVKDGMDISLCSFDKDNNELEYAGAINSLFYIKENSLKEVKGDKQPIGQFNDIKPFTNHKLALAKGDTVYLFSDGYPDQFGGEKGKKYMYKRFRELMLGISKKEFSKQMIELETEFEEWRGNLEQLDDVCVIGVKI
ncbi:MAG: tetratricopeptide repeat protein [Vicingaceae bacterium]|nr:tetratricopeptide repeat protein [Vicingaceae bacterium]